MRRQRQTILEFSFVSVCAHPHPLHTHTDEHIHDRSCRVEKIEEGRLYILRDQSGDWWDWSETSCKEEGVEFLLVSCWTKTFQTWLLPPKKEKNKPKIYKIPQIAQRGRPPIVMANYVYICVLACSVDQTLTLAV